MTCFTIGKKWQFCRFMLAANPSLTVGRYGLINRGKTFPAGVMSKRPSLISTQRRLFRASFTMAPFLSPESCHHHLVF